MEKLHVFTPFALAISSTPSSILAATETEQTAPQRRNCPSFLEVRVAFSLHLLGIGSQTFCVQIGAGRPTGSSTGRRAGCAGAAVGMLRGRSLASGRERGFLTLTTME